jgi:hypothetical protein
MLQPRDDQELAMEDTEKLPALLIAIMQDFNRNSPTGLRIG